MFIIKPIDDVDLVHAIKLLSFFNVRYESMMNEKGTQVIILVNEEKQGHALDNCEKAFDLNFVQDVKAMACEMCAMRGEHVCTHVTFSALRDSDAIELTDEIKEK